MQVPLVLKSSPHDCRSCVVSWILWLDLVVGLLFTFWCGVAGGVWGNSKGGKALL